MRFNHTVFVYALVGCSVLLAYPTQAYVDPGYPNVTKPLCNEASCFGTITIPDTIPSFPSLNFLEPSWFQPVSLEDASTDASYWINDVLPFEAHRYNDAYLVIPTVGLVAPIVDIPEWSADYTALSAGKTININNHLVNGVMHFPNTAEPGEAWNMFIFWHSNGVKSRPGEFNSIFAKTMGLEPGIDQIWVFKKQSSGTFKLYKYDVESSFDTSPKNVNVMLWDGEGADITLSMCTNILWGRWIVKATLVDEWAAVPRSLRNDINAAILKIHRLPEPERSATIDRFLTVLEMAKESGKIPTDKAIIIDYILMLLSSL